MCDIPGPHVESLLLQAETRAEEEQRRIEQAALIAGLLLLIERLRDPNTPPEERAYLWWVVHWADHATRLIASAKEGELTLNQIRVSGRMALRDAVYGAARAAKGSNLSLEDLERIRSVLDDQTMHWDRFIDSIALDRHNLARRGLPEEQLEIARDHMYERATLRAQSYFGIIAATGAWFALRYHGRPEDIFEWTLGEAEHCPTCIARAGMRFPRSQLPWMPRDGSTLCLFRCHCSWELVVEPA